MAVGVGTILAGAGAVSGLISGITGSRAAKRAARERRRLIREQKARNEAWYNRNYYEDYMNSVNAQAAIKRVRDAWREKTQEARARQAVTGGTPEQAAAVAEQGGEALGNTMATIAAQGEQNKRQVDAQKAAMDANINAQEGAIADAEQQAGMNLMENGVNTLTGSLKAALTPETKATENAQAPETPEVPNGNPATDGNIPATDLEQDKWKNLYA